MNPQQYQPVAPTPQAAPQPVPQPATPQAAVPQSAPQATVPQMTTPQSALQSAAQSAPQSAAQSASQPFASTYTPSTYAQPAQAAPTRLFPTQPLSPLQTPAAPAVPTPPIPDKANATQTTLLISEIRDSLVIMKDGSFRAVVACKSINFDLMSEAEREGIEYSYQGFLNSLNFTTQILIRSQRVDIGPYLERLTEIRKNNDNMLLGVLMDDYINFVDILSQEANIMDKSFFIVIPYYSTNDAEKAVNQTKNIFSSLFKSKNQAVTRIDRATYDKAVTEINNRVEAIISGLYQIGVHSVRLNTKELSELYYNFNNPDTAVREPFIDFSKMATTYVKKGDPKNA